MDGGVVAAVSVGAARILASRDCPWLAPEEAPPLADEAAAAATAVAVAAAAVAAAIVTAAPFAGTGSAPSAAAAEVSPAPVLHPLPSARRCHTMLKDEDGPPMAAPGGLAGCKAAIVWSIDEPRSAEEMSRLLGFLNP